MEETSRSFWKMKLLLFFAVSCWMFVGSGSAGSVQKNITAVEEETVTLPCKAPDKMEILVVEWSRSDLGREDDVLIYRDGHIDPDNHPSYVNRVDLKDRDMKDGDVSLILKNVTFSDSGIFECFIVQREITRRRKSSASVTESISSISLTVAPPSGPGGQGGDGGTEDGPSRGRDALTVGLTVAALVVVVVVWLFLRQKMKMKKSPPLPPAGSDPNQEKPLNQFDSERQTGDTSSSVMKTMESPPSPWRTSCSPPSPWRTSWPPPSCFLLLELTPCRGGEACVLRGQRSDNANKMIHIRTQSQTKINSHSQYLDQFSSENIEKTWSLSNDLLSLRIESEPVPHREVVSS